eukprot:TRINITY_DN33833_c0_g1_i1.p1 TRINITY_DN33833_c0_g1~~TRINITY_DN33833_c0_g1_i1.p1  ORF type:complete len:101 (+),score=34.55 TRINITY_DN33833_c0_g1_i1:60-362(+)
MCKRDSFNIGEYRRRKHGSAAKSEFFSPLNEEGMQQRQELAAEAMADLKAWMSEVNTLGRVGVYLSLIHISEPTRLLSISYAVFCLKKKTPNHTPSPSSS